MPGKKTKSEKLFKLRQSSDVPIEKMAKSNKSFELGRIFDDFCSKKKTKSKKKFELERILDLVPIERTTNTEK